MSITKATVHRRYQISAEQESFECGKIPGAADTSCIKRQSVEQPQKMQQIHVSKRCINTPASKFPSRQSPKKNQSAHTKIPHPSATRNYLKSINSPPNSQSIHHPRKKLKYSHMHINPRPVNAFPTTTPAHQFMRFLIPHSHPIPIHLSPPNSLPTTSAQPPDSDHPRLHRGQGYG